MGPGILLALAGLLAVIGGLWDYFSRLGDLNTTRGFITGGDSFVFIEHAQLTDDYKEIYFRLHHEGSFPVYDVQLSVYEVDENWNELVYPDTSFARPPIQDHSLSVVSPAHTAPIFRVRSFKEGQVPDVLRYKVIFSMRNGFLVQYMKLQHTKEGWDQDLAVLTGEELEILRTSQGDVDDLIAEIANLKSNIGKTTNVRLLGLTNDQIDLRRDVYTRIDLACHGWKNSYMAIRLEGPKYFDQYGTQFGTSIWDTLREAPKPTYSIDNWRHYGRLFDQDILTVARSLQEILTTHSAVLPDELKTLMMQTISQLNLERSVYHSVLPTDFIEDKNHFFEYRFREVVVRLETLSREMDRLRDQL